MLRHLLSPCDNPRPAHRAASAVVVMVVLAGALSACSDGDEAATPAPTGPGPLSEYLSAISLPVSEVTSFNARLNARSQEEIAVCMTAKGFEYTPAPYAQPGDSPQLEPDNESWVAQYGFGSAGGFGDIPFTPPPNPNDVYIASLSETARDAYWDAFSGSGFTADAEDITEEDIYTQTGCIGEAARVIDEEDAAEDPYDSPEFAELTTAIQDLVGAALLEPEMIDLAAQWSSCMADAGFAFTSREDMHDHITVVRNNLPYPHEDGAAEALAAADEEEIATALADLTCRRDVGWDTRAAQVQEDLERRFIADHKAELDELIAAVESSKP